MAFENQNLSRTHGNSHEKILESSLYIFKKLEIGLSITNQGKLYNYRTAVFITTLIFGLGNQ